MGAEVVETQPVEAPTFHKQGVIHLEALEVLLGGQVAEVEAWSVSEEPVTRTPELSAHQSDAASEASDDPLQADVAARPSDEPPVSCQPNFDMLSEPASDAASEPEALECEETRTEPAETFQEEPSVLPEKPLAEPLEDTTAVASDACKAQETQPQSLSQRAAQPTEEKGPKKKVLFNASHSDYDVVAAAAEARGWRVVKQEERAGPCNVHWIDDANIGDWLRRVEPWMRVNHFPGMNNALARKSRLARNMARMMRAFPESYRFIPPTWVLPDDVGDLTKRMENNGETKAIYIVKPDHLCQGRGIFLTTDCERIKKVAADSREKDQAVVVQRYITRPMLIEGLKFDLRLYLLVTGVLGEGGTLEPRYFLFRDGLVRLCTTPYEPPTPETMENRCMHLTNYAINKNSKDFQQNDGADGGSGSKRSLRWFMDFVETEFGAKERRRLWHKLIGLCDKTLLTVHTTLEAEYTGTFPKDLTGGQMGCRCFEILGVDVMLDAKRKPYLIEVNHLPSFTCDSPLDEDIKSRLIEQTMDLTCGSISAKDKRAYDQLVRDRREAAASAAATPASASAAATPATSSAATLEQTSGPAQSLLELPEYKDFERAYPPPASAPKLAAQCEAILARVREIYRPVQAARRPRLSQDCPESGQPMAPQRPPPLPPRPPAAPSSASNASAASSATSARPASRERGVRPPQAESVANSTVPAAMRRIAASLAKAEGEGTARPPRKQRSRSAPGPPRCALPPITRCSSPRLARHKSASPERSEDAAAAPPRQGCMVRVPSRQRGVFLQLKSAQILL